MKTALFTLALLAQLATAQAATQTTLPSSEDVATSASAPAANGGELVAQASTTRRKR